MRRHFTSPFSFFLSWFVANLSACCVCAVKKHPKLKSRYKRRVQAATEYTMTIEDFDDLVESKTLAPHCLGPEPSPFVLHTIEIEENSKCSFGLSLTWILFFKQVFLFFCGDDDEVQSRDVHQDEGQEE